MNNFFTDVAVGWIKRRIPEFGGLAVTLGSVALWLLDAYSRLTPQDQEAIGQLLSGNWKTVTLGTVAGLASWLFAQRNSFRATVTPQIVTEEGEKVETEKQLDRSLKDTIEQVVVDKAVPKPKKKMGGLFDWFMN